MAAIFGAASQAVYKGAFRTTQNSYLTFNNRGALTLIQNLQVSHQQPVTPLFEVGTNNRYYVVGKASGTFSATQVLGFGDDALKQVTSLADPCTGNRRLVLSIPSAYCTPTPLPNPPGVANAAPAPGAVAGAALKANLVLTLDGVLLQSVGFSIAAQDNLINSQIQGLLTDLSYTFDKAGVAK